MNVESINGENNFLCIAEYPTGKISASNWTSLNFTNTDTSVEQVGCPTRYTWCEYTPKVHISQYFIALLLGAIGYPLANISVSVLYSLIVGRQKQVKRLNV